MFKKLVLMLSLVACTGLNAVQEEEIPAKVGFGTKVKNFVWTNRTKTQLGLVAAFFAYVGARMCVANKWLKADVLVEKVGGLLTTNVECMKCANPANMKGTFMQTAAQELVGYNSTIPLLPLTLDGKFPFVHKA